MSGQAALLPAPDCLDGSLEFLNRLFRAGSPESLRELDHFKLTFYTFGCFLFLRNDHFGLAGLHDILIM